MGKTIYFLGIGGIGMSALARFYMQRGERVAGYDHARTALTDSLQTEGAQIHFDEDINQIPTDVDFVIYTPAIPTDSQEFIYFQEKGIPMYKRSQMLGKLAQGFPTVAVAGTHGKTTTTAMIAQLLLPYRRLLAFIGGIAKNFDGNFLLHHNYDTVVAEADEFDRSFLTLFPTIAVITSMDADHLDIYGDKQQLMESFQLFANQIDKNGYLIIHEAVADKINHPHKLVYGVGDKCDFRISAVEMHENRASFTLATADFCYQKIEMRVSGMHNVLNAAAACAVGSIMQLTETQIKTQMNDFRGVKRRFDYQIETEDLVFIDDYAHHPEEIRAILTSVKKLYPHKEVTVIFQPHLYSRTRDFAQQFANILALADQVILLDIYPARELPIPGITSQFLLDLIPMSCKKLLKKEELLPYLQQNRPKILLTIGAGDIDKLVPVIRAGLSS
ncbi:MAG: UDP-N-acetylmuramate--L-alanine ligase [Bacteroidales bacterium]|jgi:UDP-N-acetylmuramate--alanine ligase|nr:UDP-N-acetylmuramate--L-alanine ligase [Bacteroidales bacterium]